jgi:epoxide hydrolase-like predicted phosphatase
MIWAIIFDCFGVLTTDLWKEFVATLPENQTQPARDINHAYDSAHLSREEFRQQIHELTGKDPGEVEALLPDQIHKNVRLLDYIASLRPTYRIGMLSNIATNWVRESLLTADEQQLFDSYIFSYEVGMTKPDARIFEIAAERLGVEPSECVMVDDIERNSIAAREAGMQAITYENFEQFKIELDRLLRA